MRAGTRAARHLPVDFKRIARVHVLRFVWLVSTYGLLPWAVFNMDETGIRFVPLKNRTWAEKGAKQVEIITEIDIDTLRRRRVVCSFIHAEQR